MRVLACALVLLCSQWSLSAREKKLFEINQNIEVFGSVLRDANLFYVDSVDNSKLTQKAIEAMLGQLDPYTNYIPESEQEDFKFMTTGEYGGIGSIIRQSNKDIVIAEPYYQMAADKVGLRAGDVILKIDTIDVKGKRVDQVSSWLKGAIGTPLTVMVKRPGAEDSLTFHFKREKIVINPVAWYGDLGQGIGYIQLSQFTEGAAAEIKKALLELKKATPLQGLILDLRNNPGGILDEAVKIVNFFTPKSKEVVATKGKINQWDRVYKTTVTPIDTVMPLVVLVNRGSASASEIVAGALQDLDRAVVLGQRTFGKGLVQTTRPLPYNGNLKVTTAKYYIPSGRCVQALDYSHRNEDGSVGAVPDSLTNVFYTARKRPVRDGGGITPDSTISEPKSPNILFYLYKDNYFFDFATLYAQKHPSLISVDQYQLSDTTYQEFKAFVKNKNFTYDQQTEKMLGQIKEWATFEGYWEDSKEEFEALSHKLQHNIDKDFVSFRAQIEQMLDQEIVKRYYYQKGAIEQQLKSDAEVKAAKSLLQSDAAIRKILYPDAATLNHLLVEVSKKKNK